MYDKALEAGVILISKDGTKIVERDETDLAKLIEVDDQGDQVMSFAEQPGPRRGGAPTLLGFVLLVLSTKEASARSRTTT